MAKQKKRTQKSLSGANPRNYSSLYKDDRTSVPQGQTGDVDAQKETAIAPAGGKESDSVDWKIEYAYVRGDLVQLAIVCSLH